MRNLIKLILVYLVLGTMACGRICPDEELSLVQEDYLGSDLRIDGYYSNCANGGDELFFLYRNGLYYNPNIKDLCLTLIVDTNFIAPTSNKGNYGLFSAKNGLIKLEYWDPLTFFASQTMEGNILNDTTLLFTKTYRTYQSNAITTINDEYKFTAYSNKPDSTNNFIP